VICPICNAEEDSNHIYWGMKGKNIFPIFSYFFVGAGFPEHYDPYAVYCTSPIGILQVAKRTPQRPFVLPESRGTCSSPECPFALPENRGTNSIVSVLATTVGGKQPNQFCSGTPFGSMRFFYVQ
jgi:hypothetical protein